MHNLLLIDVSNIFRSFFSKFFIEIWNADQRNELTKKKIKILDSKHNTLHASVERKLEKFIRNAHVSMNFTTT